MRLDTKITITAGGADHHVTLGEITNAITLFLDDSMRRAPWKGHKNRLAGHCYVASETLYHLVPGMKPMFIRHEGAPHWFLVDSDGDVHDLTAGQFRTPVPYGDATGKGFLTKGPSKRARLHMETVTCVYHCNRWGCDCGVDR
tara:strand:+ start:102 stop:530 length:429 start_codon:yes stop_codon:yes gene_type:complete